jgi:hypothetical protein
VAGSVRANTTLYFAADREHFLDITGRFYPGVSA